MTTAAQAEFNELLRDKDTDNRHPEDRLDASDRSDNDSAAAAADADDYNEKLDTDDELDLPKDMRSNNYYLPSIRSEANTGPKGVIADAHAFEKAKKQARRFTWKKNSPPPTYTVSVSSYNDEKAGSDQEEDSFMQRWRESRLRELQNAGQRIRSRTTSPSQRIYGSLQIVDAIGFLEAIEKVSRDTVVVVFIHDDQSPISAEFEECFRGLAHKHKTTRFLKLSYQEAEMEVAGVPAVLAYKRAEKFAGLVPLVEEMPDDSELTEVSVETLLRRHQILF